jgi:hypothetical protein
MTTKTRKLRQGMTSEHFRTFGAGYLPGLVGVEILTAREGALRCRATPVHLGRTTQVWDAVVANEATEAKLALFRCTQMVLWPKA